MLRCMYSGISGMKVNQTKLDVIGNNIANVGTTAFKASSAKFKDILDSVKNKDEGFTISKHAAVRLNEINFTEEDMKQIEKGFRIAKDKNSKNTVMLYKDVALIASVENKTLITAVEKERAKNNIFTNVDSVVIL